jgi:hypothetical protein
MSVDVRVPGWAESMGKALASKDEGERAEAIGLPRLRCFRRSATKDAQSCSRGGEIGALSRARKRKLSLGHLD